MSESAATSHGRETRSRETSPPISEREARDEARLHVVVRHLAGDVEKGRAAFAPQGHAPIGGNGRSDACAVSQQLQKGRDIRGRDLGLAAIHHVVALAQGEGPPCRDPHACDVAGDGEIELAGSDPGAAKIDLGRAVQAGEVRPIDPAPGTVGRKADGQALGPPIHRLDPSLERPASDTTLCRRAQSQFRRARHRRNPLGGDVEIERPLAHEMRHELRNPPDPHAAEQVDQRIGALRRDLARDLSRSVRRDAAADAGIGSREIDDVEGLDQQRRAVGQDAGGNPPRRRALARADAARIQDEADIDLLGRLEDTGQLRQVVEIQALDRDLRLDLAALVGFRRRVADIAGQGRLAGLQPQAVEGQDGVRKGDFRGGLDGAPVEHPQERRVDADAGEIAGKPVGCIGGESDLAVDAAPGGQAELTLQRHPGFTWRRELDPIEPRPPGVEGQAQIGVRQVLLGQPDAVDLEIEIDGDMDHRQRPLLQPALEVLSVAREDEAVRIEPAPFELQGNARLVEPDPALAGHAQARAALPGFEADGIELDGAGHRLELGLDGDGNRDAGGRNLRGRAEQDLGLARHVRSRRIAHPLVQAEAGIEIEAGIDVAAAGELDLDGLVLGQLARDQPERHAGSRALHTPRPDQPLPLDGDVFGKSLIRPARARALGRHEKLGDAEILDRPATGAAAARHQIRRQAPFAVTRDRDPDIGPPHPRFREAHIPLQQRHQGHFGADVIGVENRRIRRLAAETQSPEGDPGRGQQADADRALGLGLGAGCARNQVIDRVAMRLPGDEGRSCHGNRQDQDHDGCDDRQDIAQEAAFSPLR